MNWGLLIFDESSKSVLMSRFLNLIVFVAAPVVTVLSLISCDGLANPDVVPPTVVIIYPVDGSYLSEPDTIKAQAADNDAVESVDFLIDGAEIGTVRQPPYEQFWDLTFWNDGNYHSVLARATDAAGNVGFSNLVNVRTFVSGGIWPDLIAPANDSVLAVSDPVTFGWHGVRNAVKYELEISPNYGFSDDIITVIATDTTTAVSDLIARSYYWRVRALNNVGRSSSWSDARRFYLVSDLADQLSFTEYEFNPIISQANENSNSNYNLDPSVIYEGGMYKMWYSSILSGHFCVRYAT